MAPIDPVIQDLQTRCFREMSAHRKLELADELIVLALELKTASLRRLHPGLSEPELRAQAIALLADVAG
jgi:hypothetical protein